MSAESPELLDAFKAAALSVTKLYKLSAAAQAKARSDGYQDCLDDLLAFLDKESTGGEGIRIRKWATDRMDGREAPSQGIESEDEAEKSDTTSSPEIHGSAHTTTGSRSRNEVQMRDSAPPALPPALPPAPTHSVTKIDELPEIVVPSQETFTFHSQHPYPQDAHLNLANLDLSDSRAHESSSRSATSTASMRVASRRSGSRTGTRTTLGRGAGQKRKVNLAEIFDLKSLGHGNGKDMFGGGKRGRFI